MLRFADIVFGPIYSRRLGSSLGVNLLPASGKLCNFDCIYCECGWNRDGRTTDAMPDVDDVKAALEQALTSARDSGTAIDSSTFSGNGEPTLNPHFPEIVDAVLSLRDKHYPSAAVSVLSNATTVGNPLILDALRRVDNPIMKIDAPTAALAAKINRPSSIYNPQKIVDSLKAFGGDFVLQTMLLCAPDFDSASEEFISSWTDMVVSLKPRLTMVYSIDRETPQKNLEKLTYREMEDIVRPVVEKGLAVKIY